METVIAPTCTKKGYTLHKCSCGEEYKDNETEALEHLFGEWNVTTPATEEKDGEETRACTRENCDYYETRKIPALNHTHLYTETVVEPTCTEKGYTLHKCECGEEYKDGETEALGHLFGAWETITPATEDSEGLEQRVCARKNCGFKEERAIPVLSHTHHYITTIVEPTCTERGYTKYTCEKCGNSYNADYEKPLGHNFGEWKEIKPATEEEDGLKERTCARCGETEEQAIPAKTHEHKFVDTVIEPTCTEKGYTVHKCKCGEQYEDSYVSALDHSFTNYVSDGNATCTQDGTKTAKCDRCDETKTIADEGSAKGHKPSDYISDKEPTCTETGSKHKECTVCGETLETAELPALDHSFTNYVSDGNATCTKDGTKTAKCDRCDETKTIADEGSAKGHKPSDYISDKEPTCTEAGSKHKECTVCGEMLETVEVPSKGHGYSTEWTVDKEATCQKTGIKSHHCTRCEAKTDETEIPLADHNYVNGICTVCGAKALEEATGLAYKLSDNGMYYIVTGIGEEKRKEFAIPESYNGKPVKEIGEMAFSGCASRTSITIPDGVKSIGRSAFSGCSSLTSITIPDSVTSIGGSAFSYCRSLNYNIKDNVKYLGNEKNPYMVVMGVTDNSLSSYKIDKWTRFLHSGAFSGCTSLTSIDIPNGVTSIGDYVFNECRALTGVTIPDGVTSIGGSAFSYCSSLTSIIIPDSVRSIDYRAFSGCTSLTSIVIPDSVTSIGKYVFCKCTTLTRVTIGNGVTSIGYGAFEYCSSLTSVTIGNGVTSIGYMAFYDCGSLTGVYITDIAAWCNIKFGDNPLSYAHNLYLNNELVTELIIPDSVTNIGGYAFYNCGSLTSINIPDSVTSIGSRAFSGCSSLTSITIPDSVTSIGYGAFFGCSALTSIVIPESVTSIGERAFSGCSSLNYNVKDNVKYLGNEKNPYMVVVGVTDNSLSSYKIDKGARFLHSYAFDKCSSLTSITIPDSVASIGSWAFYKCTSLTRVTIGNGVTSIGYNALVDCTSLTDITYNGTKAEWQSIEKGDYWKKEVHYFTVHCTDGDLTKEEA